MSSSSFHLGDKNYSIILHRSISLHLKPKTFSNGFTLISILSPTHSCYFSPETCLPDASKSISPTTLGLLAPHCTTTALNGIMQKAKFVGK